VENCYPTHQMHSQISMDERWPNEITALDAAIARLSPWGARARRATTDAERFPLTYG
jgi:hypothetical protein